MIEDDKNQSKKGKTDAITAASPQTKEPFDLALLKSYGKLYRA